MFSLRSWATPLTVGAFLVSGVTGVLMFFHLDSGLNKTVHEWLSWALVAGVGLHLAVNWRAFRGYLKRPRALAIVGVFAAMLAASFVIPAGAGGSPMAAVMGGLGQAPVDRVIALTGQEAAAGMARLQAAGFEPAPGQTIAALAGGDRGKQGEILKVIFGG